MRRVKEAIIVEGRYDKNALSQVVDAVIIETGGFRIFTDAENLELIRRMQKKRGVIIMTDGDGAGFLIRGRLKGALEAGVKHAYIPDVSGRERRKRAASKEGKLGVEGMRPEVLLEALERAGATFEDEEERAPRETLTKADMYAMGLTGGENSAGRRRKLLAELGLPERLSSNALLEVLCCLYEKSEILEMCRNLR